jgi:Ca-activated chloride channel family protein
MFIVDVSGSMFGFPLEISKKLLKDLIGSLRPTDTFNVLLFSGGSAAMAEKALPATPDNIQRALTVIDKQKGGGGTELLPALKHAFSMLSKDNKVSNTVVIATDGYVTVEKEVFDLIRTNLGNTNVFTFGIGTSVNRFLLEGMARAGKGEPFVISKADEAPAMADKFRKMLDSPVLTKISVDFGRLKTKDVEPAHVPDVMLNRPITIFGKYSGEPEGVITIKGTAGDGPVTQKIDIANVKPLPTNGAIKYLWARDRIAHLADYNRLGKDNALVAEVTELGLKYSLLTDYTSFVAVDTEVRLKDGKAVTVKQPLPLPEGVSEYAVGGSRADGARYSHARRPMPVVPPAQAGKMAKQTETSEPAADIEKPRELPPAAEVSIQVTAKEISSADAEAAIKNTSFPAIIRTAAANKVKGTAVIKISTAPDGKVIKAERINGTIVNTGWLIEILKQIVFPTTPNGAEIKVTFTINAQGK